jgi:hypothetical protein
VRSGPKHRVSAHHAHFPEEEAGRGSRPVVATPSVRCNDDPAPGLRIQTKARLPASSAGRAEGQQPDEPIATRRPMEHLPLPLRVDPGRHLQRPWP